jgi:hypothetical protein
MANKKRTAGESSIATKKARVRWPFPRATLEEALKIASPLRNITAGTHGSPTRYGSDWGRHRWQHVLLSYCSVTRLRADNRYKHRREDRAYFRAFLNVDIFKRVLEYYKGSNLPEMKYLGNTLRRSLGSNQRPTRSSRELSGRIASILESRPAFQLRTERQAG